LTCNKCYISLLRQTNKEMKTIVVENKKTGEQFTAQYACNRLGNKRMWVNGKFYSDKEYDKTFKVIEVKYL
jgi:hypothetical protein